MSDLVHLEVSGGVATITLDSPANRNALSRQLTAELADRFQRAIDDSKVRAIVLTGTGTVFCSGADLREQRDANQSGGNTGPTGVAPILEAMWHSPKPVLGRINGPARAGGIGLLAACDISVGIEDSTFAINEVRIGVIPAIISVVVLRKVALTTAMELFLTGATFSGRRAVEIGLMTAAAPSFELDSSVSGYLEALRMGAPNALAGAKRLVREVPGMEMHAAFEAMAQRSAEHFASPEALEGMTAFAEKRPPSWVVS